MGDSLLKNNLIMIYWNTLTPTTLWIGESEICNFKVTIFCKIKKWIVTIESNEFKTIEGFYKSFEQAVEACIKFEEKHKNQQLNTDYNCSLNKILQNSQK